MISEDEISLESLLNKGSCSSMMSDSGQISHDCFFVAFLSCLGRKHGRRAGWTLEMVR